MYPSPPLRHKLYAASDNTKLTLTVYEPSLEDVRALVGYFADSLDVVETSKVLVLIHGWRCTGRPRADMRQWHGCYWSRISTGGYI
jgi:hypothetical protein